MNSLINYNNTEGTFFWYRLVWPQRATHHRYSAIQPWYTCTVPWYVRTYNVMSQLSDWKSIRVRTMVLEYHWYSRF
jgi:hypothetical protein